MINSSKLLSRATSNRNLISRKVLVDLTIVKRDAVKVDNLLKERLVLTKVREGIMRQQRENEMRREREQQLEEKRDDESANVDPNKKKQPKSLLGNIIKFVLTGFLKVIGRLTLGILPRLPFLLKTIVRFTRFFGTIIRGTFNVARTLIKVAPKFISNFGKFTGKIITQIIGVITKSIVPAASGFVGRVAGLLSAPFAGAGTRAITGGAAKTVEAKAAAKSTADTSAKIRAEREIRKKASKDISNRQILERFGEEDVLTGEGRRITKTGQPVAKTAATGFVETTGRRTVIAPKKGEREASQKLLESLFKKQNKQLNLFSFLAEEPTRISDIDFRNLKDFTDGKLSSNDLDARILRQRRGLDKVNLDNIKLGNVRQQAEITKILNKSVGTQTKARKLARQQRNIKKIIRPKKGEIEASQKLIENLAKKSPASLGKKGLSKILFNVGGEALEQSVKQSIKASIGVIPILGDLIGVLLDVFLFGEPVGRAVFKGIGSLALGALLGGVGTFLGGPVGTLIGSIIGGIGGDILGGIAYDLFFGRKPQAGGYSTVTGGGKEYLKGVSKAVAVQNFKEGGLVARKSRNKKNSGIDPRILELYPELDPMKPSDYIKLKRKTLPVDLALRSQAFYERNQVGREVIIPIPVPISNNKNQSGGGNIVIHSKNVQKRNSFSQLYRRG